VLLVNFRKGVGIMTVAILFALFLGELIIYDFFFFELKLFI
jgi:hypothetical protein